MSMGLAELCRDVEVIRTAYGVSNLTYLHISHQIPLPAFIEALLSSPEECFSFYTDPGFMIKYRTPDGRIGGYVQSESVQGLREKITPVQMTLIPAEREPFCVYISDEWICNAGHFIFELNNEGHGIIQIRPFGDYERYLRTFFPEIRTDYSGNNTVVHGAGKKPAEIWSRNIERYRQPLAEMHQ